MGLRTVVFNIISVCFKGVFELHHINSCFKLMDNFQSCFSNKLSKLIELDQFHLSCEGWSVWVVGCWEMFEILNVGVNFMGLIDFNVSFRHINGHISDTQKPVPSSVF